MIGSASKVFTDANLPTSLNPIPSSNLEPKKKVHRGLAGTKNKNGSK
ncbi:hypothetical protein VCHA52P454_10725 [Vibrio chagasii]|nr:hypothetical protein VCHA52P454_10725 [Vibrio chagasii]